MNIQNITRLEDLFPKYQALDQASRPMYIPQMEEKFYGSPIKEAFAKFFRSLIFTKIEMKKSKNSTLSLYRANIATNTIETRFYTLFVYEPNAEIISLGKEKSLRELLPCKWVAFQSGESVDEAEGFDQYKSVYDKKQNASNPIVLGLNKQEFQFPDEPTLLNDKMARFKTTDDGVIYRNLTQDIEVFLISHRDLTVEDTTILKCLNTFAAIAKFANG